MPIKLSLPRPGHSNPQSIVRDVQSSYRTLRSDIGASGAAVARGFSAAGKYASSPVPGYKEWATRASYLTSRLPSLRGVSPSGALQGLNPLAGTPLSKYARAGSYAGIALSAAGGAAFLVAPAGDEAEVGLARVPAAAAYGEDAIRAGYFGRSAEEYRSAVSAGLVTARDIGPETRGLGAAAVGADKLASYAPEEITDASKVAASSARFSPEVAGARASLAASGWRGASYLIKGAAIGGAVALGGYGSYVGLSYLAGGVSNIGAGLQNLINPGSQQINLPGGGSSGGGGTTPSSSSGLLGDLASSPLVIIAVVLIGGYLIVTSARKSKSSGSSGSAS